jgi:hypothetical protein
MTVRSQLLSEATRGDSALVGIRSPERSLANNLARISCSRITTSSCAISRTSTGYLCFLARRWTPTLAPSVQDEKSPLARQIVSESSAFSNEDVCAGVWAFIWSAACSGRLPKHIIGWCAYVKPSYRFFHRTTAPRPIAPKPQFIPRASIANRTSMGGGCASPVATLGQPRYPRHGPDRYKSCFFQSFFGPCRLA